MATTSPFSSRWNAVALPPPEPVLAAANAVTSANTDAIVAFSSASTAIVNTDTIAWYAFLIVASIMVSDCMLLNLSV